MGYIITYIIIFGILAICCILYAEYIYKNAKEMEEGINGMVEITPEIKHALNELKYMEEDKVFQTVALDFDGTVVEHNYPRVGKSLPLCVETLKRWQEKYKVGYILSTMRSGEMLEDAINWFKTNGIELLVFKNIQHKKNGLVLPNVMQDIVLIET